MLIKYLHHGLVITGGVRFERKLCKSILSKLTDLKIDTEVKESWYKNLTVGFEHFNLLSWAKKESKEAQLLVLVGRLLLIGIYRAFQGKKVIVVFHNFDKNQNSSMLNLYYWICFLLIRLSQPKNLKIIVVSKFFEGAFQNKIPLNNLLLIPNLFDISYYDTIKSRAKTKYPERIILGQASTKYSSDIYKVAQELHNLGYDCYFLGLENQTLPISNSYKIIQLSFEEYLLFMAESLCCLSLSGVKEGWPRMVHESFLMDTQVIGYNMGGLGDLLREANGIIVSNYKDVVNYIVSNSDLLLNYKAPQTFKERYSTTNADEYLKPLINFTTKI